MMPLLELPAAGGRSSGASPTGISWVGPGRTAFAAPVAVGGARSPRHCTNPQAIAESLGQAADSPRALALQEYFAAGGQDCFVLSDERLYDAAWIGEDAGPGARSGVLALAELDSVGAIVILAPSSGVGTTRREEALLDLAQRRPDLLFLMATARSDSPAKTSSALMFLQHNVVTVDLRQVSVGSLAGLLEATDWRAERGYRSSSAIFPAAIEPEDLARLQAWRRLSGLRRSIDRGTRWIVFEPSYPLLWRTLEREVRAFLGRLERLGFFGGAAEFRVECEPAWDSETGRADASHLRLKVSAGGVDFAAQLTRSI